MAQSRSGKMKLDGFILAVCALIVAVMDSGRGPFCAGRMSEFPNCVGAFVSPIAWGHLLDQNGTDLSERFGFLEKYHIHMYQVVG